MPSRRFRAALLAGLAATAAAAVPAAASKPPPRYAPHVVVATLDTGTNPFHPAWRRNLQAHPSTYLPGYPAGTPAARLAFRPDFQDSVTDSEAELAKFGEGMTWVPGTNIVGTWADDTDEAPVFDPRGSSHSHGARASSQIAGRGLGLAPDALVVVLDRTPDGSSTSVAEANATALRWAADQPWIDVIHTNIQDFMPLNREENVATPNFPDAVAYAISKGKVVVSAGGNFYGETTETSPHAGPPGVLVAGANDNCGYTDFSNPDPHVVMDGMGTVAAAPDGFGTVGFSGTSSASPRIAGYVADLLLRLRRTYGYTGGVTADGALLTVPPARRPHAGPLGDGRLTAAELHEVVRKTADPRAHDSAWDGTQDVTCVPELVTSGPSFYPKMGYGEVSEHTIGAAYDVASGRKPMPARPDEDQWYQASEELRRRFWS